MRKSDEIALIFPLLNGDHNKQIAAIGPNVQPQRVVERMTWAVDVYFSSSSDFELELRTKEPTSTFCPTLITVLATGDATMYDT